MPASIARLGKAVPPILRLPPLDASLPSGHAVHLLAHAQ